MHSHDSDITSDKGVASDAVAACTQAAKEAAEHKAPLRSVRERLDVFGAGCLRYGALWRSWRQN